MRPLMDTFVAMKRVGTLYTNILALFTHVLLLVVIYGQLFTGLQYHDNLFHLRSHTISGLPHLCLHILHNNLFCK